MGQTISNALNSSVVWSRPSAQDEMENEPSSVGGGCPPQERQPFSIPVERITNAQSSVQALFPVRASSNAAGFDLHANEDTTLPPAHDGQGTAISTGVKLALDATLFALPPSTVLFGDLRGRSSLAKKGIRVFQGTIDADYRGEVKVLMFNDTQDTFTINKGDRIAQLLIGVALVPTFIDQADITTTFASLRGEGGFGSTGAAPLQKDEQKDTDDSGPKLEVNEP